MAYQDIIIYRSTAGILVNLETFQDLSIFSSLEVSIQDPVEGTSLITASINNTTNTQMEFLSGTSTFPIAGVYKLQSVADGIRGETAVIDVRELFE